MPRSIMANGNIYPCRFVTLDTAGTPDTYYNASGNFKVIEVALTTAPIFGVSQEGTDWPPITDSHITNAGYAAVAGELLKVYTVGDECLIEIAEQITAGQMIKANWVSAYSSATTDGKGAAVVMTSGCTVPQFYGGFAMQDGWTGDKIKMLVQPGIYVYQ